MKAHSSSSWVQRFRAWWDRVFFWQKAPPVSREVAPPNEHDRHLVAAVTQPTVLPAWRQLRYFTYVFPQKERVQLWAALAAAICFLGVSAGLFLQPHIVAQPAQGGMLAEGLIGTPKWINPVLAPLNSESDIDRVLSSLVFSGLFANTSITTTPDLAASYQLLENGKAFEVRLREDARFHDGQPVTADDVLFTINDAIKNPLWHSPLMSDFAAIEAIRVDDSTVQLKTLEGTLTITEWQRLLTVGILPAHRWESTNEGSPQLAEANLKPIGSGPYQFSSFVRDSKGLILAYTFTRFAGYYGEAPYLDERIFRFYPDRSAANAALESNQIDALAFVPWNDEARLRITDSTSYAIELPQTTTVFLNTQDVLLKSVTVRKALQMAIDRGELIQNAGHGTALQSPFPFFESYSTSTQLSNIEGARELLEAANWKIEPTTGLRYLQPAVTQARGRIASSTIAFVTSTPLSITLLVPDQGDLASIAELIKRRWSLLGAQVNVELHDRPAILRQALTDHTHQAVIINAYAPTDADLLPFWTTDGQVNFSRWSSTALINALQGAASATSTDALLASRTKAAEILSSNVPAIFLLRPSHAYIVPANLHGASAMQIQKPDDRLHESFGWYTKTRWRWQRTP